MTVSRLTCHADIAQNNRLFRPGKFWGARPSPRAPEYNQGTPSCTMRSTWSRSLVWVALLSLPGSACQQPPKATSPATDAYVPGLGELMTLQQMRHTKLWLAGEAGNWPLAAYEIKELGEGFDDIVKFHPTHEESPGDELWLQRRAAAGDESLSESSLRASGEVGQRLAKFVEHHRSDERYRRTRRLQHRGGTSTK